MIDSNLMARIRQRAYEIWEDEGRPQGRDRIHWLRAEAEFRETISPGGPAKRGTMPKPQKSAPPAQHATRTVRTS